MGALNDLPPELVAGWCIWLLGGLALLVWFWRASAPRVASQSGVRPIARPPQPRAAPADPFNELQQLLDPGDRRDDV